MTDKLIKGFTCGAMDVFHAGHVLMMEDCKRHCDYLIVGLHTNPQLDRADKNKPIQSVVERYIQLRGSKFVDEIIPYETESDLIEILKGIDYDIRFVGDDWKDKPFKFRRRTLEVFQAPPEFQHLVGLAYNEYLGKLNFFFKVSLSQLIRFS